MSVYITIKEAHLNFNPSSDVFAEIQSVKTSIWTHLVPASKNPKWNCSFVGSIKERRLNFTVNDKKTEKKNVLLGEAPLDFNYFQYKPQQQIPYILQLTRNGEPAGKLDLNIFYTQSKNFLGEIEFYEMGSLETEVDMNSRRISHVLANKGERDRIIFYKGPCKTKNIFSCMDQSVNSEEFEILENHYREKK